jgi:hypothetical protein
MEEGERGIERKSNAASVVGKGVGASEGREKRRV